MINRKKLLIIDDDIVTLELIKNYLKLEFDIKISTTFEDALNLLENEIYDCFLLDINLVDSSGIELCKLIRKKEEYKYTPVLFITSFEDIKLIENGFKAGANDYILKPFNLHELLIRINRHCEISQSQKDLYENYNELNQKLMNLTSELRIEDIDSKYFERKEDTFRKNNRIISESISSTNNFKEKISSMEEIIKKQKEILEEAKKFL